MTIKSILTNPRIINKVFLLLIIESCICIGILAIIHNPHLSYDEANTLRTAQQDIPTIHLLLSRDQNFPLYYDLLHLLLRFFKSIELAAQFVNIAIWLLSCTAWYLVIQQYIKSKTRSLFFTLLYIHTSSIMIYAFYIRMYGIINLCVLLYLYTTARYNQKLQSRWLILQSLLCLILVLVSPVSLLILPVIFITGMVQIKNLKQRGLLLAGMICAGVIFLAQVFTKGDPYQIYVTQGRSYLTYMHSNFYDLPANLFFSLRLPEHDGINTLFFIFFFALSYIGIKHKLFSDRKILPVVVFCTEFLVIDVFLSQTLNIYHFTFLAIPVLLSLCLISTTLPGKKGLLAIVCFLLFFIPLTLRNYALILTNEIAIPKICTGIQKTANIPIITDYFSYDAITYCLGNKKSDIRLVESKDILITRTLSEKEILFAQGRNFGVAPLMLQTYKSIGKTLQPLKEYLTKNPDAPKRFAYIKFTVNFAYLFPDEILTFQDYHLQDSYFPGIYIFEKQH